MVWWVWLVMLVSVALLGAVAVAVQRPGRARDVTAWLGTVGFYLVLVGMFGSWTREALASGSRAGGIGFGFLTAMFGLGLVVALSKAIAAVRSGDSGEASATH